jgi:hypothetical protein
MKWIALAFIVIGLCLWAINADRKSSYDDCSFILYWVHIAGVALTLIGVGWLAALIFGSV